MKGNEKTNKQLLLHFIDYTKGFDSVDHNKLWKILKEMGIPDHLHCLLRNLYAAQEATVRTGHETLDWFQIGKGLHQGCVLSLCLFNLYAEYIMWNARLDDSQAGIKIAGRNSNNVTYAYYYHPSRRKGRGSEEPLDEGEIKEWKSWLKTQHPLNEDHGIQSHPFMESRWRGGGGERNWKHWQISFSWAPKSLWMVTVATKSKDTCSLKGKVWQT